MYKRTLDTLAHWKDTGLLAFCYSLLIELLSLLYLFFLGLFSLEILLPGFVSVRINMAVFFAALILLTLFVLVLGHYLDAKFSRSTKHPRLILGTTLLWSIGILGIALISFPWWSLLLLIVAFVGHFLILRNLFLEDPATL